MQYIISCILLLISLFANKDVTAVELSLDYLCNIPCDKLLNDGNDLRIITGSAELDITRFLRNIKADGGVVSDDIYIALLRILEYSGSWDKVLELSSILEDRMSAIDYYRYVFLSKVIAKAKTMTGSYTDNLSLSFYEEIANAPYVASQYFKLYRFALKSNIYRYFDKQIAEEIKNKKVIDYKLLSKVVRNVNYRRNIIHVKNKVDLLLDNGIKQIRERYKNKEDVWKGKDVGPIYNGNDVTVVVWDSGVDVDLLIEHGIAWNNSDEIPLNSVDDDNNGIVDDVHGIISHTYLSESRSLLGSLRLNSMTDLDVHNYMDVWLPCKYNLQSCRRDMISSQLEKYPITRV